MFLKAVELLPMEKVNGHFPCIAASSTSLQRNRPEADWMNDPVAEGTSWKCRSLNSSNGFERKKIIRCSVLEHFFTTCSCQLFSEEELFGQV